MMPCLMSVVGFRRIDSNQSESFRRIDLSQCWDTQRTDRPQGVHREGLPVEGLEEHPAAFMLEGLGFGVWGLGFRV